MTQIISINKKIEYFKKKIIEVEGDKSLSIRFILLSSLSNGKCTAKNLLRSEDVISAINGIKKLGIKIILKKNYCEVFGKGLKGYTYKKNLILNAKDMVDGIPQDEDHEDEWLGFRPTLPDFLPVIGPSKNYENVFYSFGHHHLGWTLGAISGKIITKMIADEKTNLDLQPYSSLRFS